MVFHNHDCGKVDINITIMENTVYITIVLTITKITQTYYVITNNTQKQQKLFVQGYNMEVRDVIKYTQKHHATVTNYITCNPGFCVT